MGQISTVYHCVKIRPLPSLHFLFYSIWSGILNPRESRQKDEGNVCDVFTVDSQIDLEILQCIFNTGRQQVTLTKPAAQFSDVVIHDLIKAIACSVARCELCIVHFLSFVGVFHGPTECDWSRRERKHFLLVLHAASELRKREVGVEVT